MANDLKRLQRQWEAHLLVRAIASQLERHDAKCEMCRFVCECHERRALRWYQGQARREESA